MTFTEKLIKNKALRSITIPAFRKYKMASQSAVLSYRRLAQRSTFSPAHQIFYIKPEEIVWLTNYCVGPETELRNRNFPMESSRGSIKGGEWDSCTYTFDQLAVSQAISSRVNEGLCWRNTEFFEECMRDIRTGRVLWGCRNKEQLDNRLSFVDQIIEDIQANGYKSGAESFLPGEDRHVIAKHAKFSDEVTVNVGRNGDFFFQDGRHRLAIAKALKIDVLPVKILVRHTLWYEKLRDHRWQEYVGSTNRAHPDLNYLIELNERV